MVVHSIVPDALTRAIDAELLVARVEHVAHGVGDPVGSAGAAAADARSIALIGPYRSRDVAEAVEASAPAGLLLLAPVATWAGVTRHDEPGCDDPARHRGTVVRLVARDTEVARRLAQDLVEWGQCALVVAGKHEYGRQLDGQLCLAGLPRAERLEDASVVVLAGLAGQPEIESAAGTSPLPLIAFDGVQGAALVEREVRVALPRSPVSGVSTDDPLLGVTAARRAAALVREAVTAGERNRAGVLAAVRHLSGCDEFGDPPDPPVWLWRADADWHVEPDRALCCPGLRPDRERIRIGRA